jgi:hypothetical protein
MRPKEIPIKTDARYPIISIVTYILAKVLKVKEKVSDNCHLTNILLFNALKFTSLSLIL